MIYIQIPQKFENKILPNIQILLIMYFNCSIQKKRAANQSKRNPQKSKRCYFFVICKGIFKPKKPQKIRVFHSHPNIQKLLLNARPIVKCTCVNKIATKYQISNIITTVLNEELHLKMYIDQPLMSHRKQCDLLLFLCRVARLLSKIIPINKVSQEFISTFKSVRFRTLVSSELNIFRKLGMSLIDATLGNFTKTSI